MVRASGEYTTCFDDLSDAQIEAGISSLTLREKKELARSRFCFIWALLLHPATKLVNAGATIKRFDECVRISLEVRLLIRGTITTPTECYAGVYTTKPTYRFVVLKNSRQNVD